jgi:hypothetical protein
MIGLRVGRKRGVLAAGSVLRPLAKENEKQSLGRGKKGLAKLPDLKPIDTRKESAKVAEARVDPLADHGANQHGKEDGGVDIINSKTKGGTDTTYTLRRLARDNPKLLDKIEAGEAVSVSVITESIP